MLFLLGCDLKVVTSEGKFKFRARGRGETNKILVGGESTGGGRIFLVGMGKMSKCLTGGGLPPSSLLIRPRGKTLTSPTFYELQPLCLILGSHIPTLTSEG